MPEQQDSQLGGQHALSKRLCVNLLEYGQLAVTLTKLYSQSRLLMIQNFILNCRIRTWNAVFICFKIQIFLIRLSNGFPLDNCWPTEESLPPVSRT